MYSKNGHLLAVILTCASWQAASAADFTWSASSPGLWSDGENWAGKSAPNGDSIVLLSPAAYGQLNLDASAVIDSFTALFSGVTWNIRAVDTARTLTIGSLVKGSSGVLTFGNGTNAALNLEIGSLSLTGGRLGLGVQNTRDQVASVTVSGKTELFGTSLLFANAASAVFGEVNLSGTSAFEIFSYAYSGASPPSGGVTVAGLSGTGGTVRVIYAANRDLRGTLTLNPGASESYSYGGVVENRGGSGGTTILSMVKNGQGTQKFSGGNAYGGATTINAGTLLVNGTHTNAGAYTVNNGGTLGGDGTIITANDADVVIKAGGKLAPGDSGFGTFTLALGNGKLDLKDTLTSAGTLLFDLGSSTTSDKIVLTSGSLDIGTGRLGLDSFLFTVSGALEEGAYTLFSSTQSIVGTLGGNLAGTLAGRHITLALGNNNQDIVLTVGAIIPEPSTLAILFGIGAIGFTVLVHHRHRSARLISDARP